MKELSKVESDIQVVIKKLMAEMTKWKKEELSNIRRLKEEASVHENKVKEKMNVLDQDNLDSGTLLMMLKVSQEGNDCLNKNTLANVYNYTKQCKALVDRVQSVLQDKNSICSQFLKQENVMESAECKSSNAQPQSVDQNFMYRVLLVYCFVVVLLFVVLLIDYITPSEDHSFINHNNLYVLYACKVTVVVTTAVAVIVVVDLSYVYNAILHAMYAINAIFPKALHFVVKYVTEKCKSVIANVPLLYAAFAFSVAVVALLLLCLIDSVTPPPEGFVYLAINYVTYVCKLFITNAVLFVVTFVIDNKKNNRTVRLDRALFNGWPFGTLIWSFMYLFTHCVSFVMTALFQFLLPSYYNPDNLKSGIVFHLVYCLDIMLDHVVWLLFVTLLILIDDGKLKFYQKQLQIYAFMYSYHIVAHIVVFFDYTLLAEAQNWLIK